jgi:hypothetical protein
MKVIAIGDTVHTVAQLQEFLQTQCTPIDIVVLESIDLQTGDVSDLFPFHMDVITGIETPLGMANEVRFCQERNTDEVQKPQMPEILLGIDWALLREQKSFLVGLQQYELSDNVEGCNVIDGILSLLDNIQDTAVDKFGVPEKLVFNLHTDSIWSEIRSCFVDKGVNADGVTYIDAYLTGDDNEEGQVIAKVNMKTGIVEYLDDRAKMDVYAIEVIQEVIDDLKDNGFYGTQPEKINPTENIV